MSLIEFHGRLGTTAMYFAVLMALWGLWRFFRRQEVDSSYWGAVVIAEILFIAQGLLGAFVYLTNPGILAGRGIHILYGVVSVLVIPGLFVYTRGDQARRAQLVYGVGFLFLIGIALRAMSTVVG